MLNSLPNNKILDCTKFKAFANDKMNVTQRLKFVLEMVETIWEKEKMPGYKHFLLFPQCFQKPSFTESLKVGILWY